MIRVRSAAVMAALAACSGSSARSPEVARRVPSPVFEPSGSGSAAPSAPGGPAAAAGEKVTLADVGLEAASLDRTSDPCVDFYQFACGGWIQNSQIPADRARWGRGSELDERNKAAIKQLLDDDARGISQDAGAKKLGDFYASCMDEGGIERAGMTAWKPLLAEFQEVKDARSWLAAVVELHKLGIFVVWDHHVRPDLTSSSTYATYLDAAGLGLPDRDYYTRPEKDKLDGYRAHAARLLGLAWRGTPAARLEAAAADVVAIETQLAQLTKTAVEQRDVPASYNPVDLKVLARQARSIDWPAYWKALGAPPSKKIILGTPRLFAGLDQLRATYKPAQWASYFTVHLLDGVGIALPRELDDQVFELQKLLTGVEKQPPRSKRCIDLTSSALGELLGQQYVARYFPGSSKQDATRLVDEIASAMHSEIAKLEWMAEATRQTAIAKLDKIVRMIGYPDRWRTYDFEVRRDDLAGNLQRSAAFAGHRELARAGKPVDRGEWQMNAYQVNAYYEPTENNTALPAGILQPPFFGADRGVAANLGGIGLVIGHELTHGFDDQGAQFDADGNLKNWWQKDDLARFADRSRCVADQYSTFEVLQKKRIQGQLTLGENIADLGGVKLAFQAYRSLRKDAPRTYVADGFTEDQQFFIAVGQAWCTRERAAETERRLTVDPHSPPKFRVYGALRNLPAFAQAFRCAPGTPMRPARTCSVW